MIKKYGILPFLFLAYIIGCVIGYFSGVSEIHTTNYNVELKNLQLYDLPKEKRFFFIFQNNMMVAFKNMFLGMFSFGIFSVIYIFYNGFIHGNIFGKSTMFFPMHIIAKATLPHSYEFIGVVLYCDSNNLTCCLF